MLPENRDISYDYESSSSSSSRFGVGVGSDKTDRKMDGNGWEGKGEKTGDGRKMEGRREVKVGEATDLTPQT